MYNIIKGKVRKRLERGEGGESFFVLFRFFWLQPVLEPRYQTTLHETQTRQDSGNVT